jgi:hypothetical protein
MWHRLVVGVGEVGQGQGDLLRREREDTSGMCDEAADRPPGVVCDGIDVQEVPPGPPIVARSSSASRPALRAGAGDPSL